MGACSLTQNIGKEVSRYHTCNEFKPRTFRHHKGYIPHECQFCKHSLEFINKKRDLLTEEEVERIFTCLERLLYEQLPHRLTAHAMAKKAMKLGLSVTSHQMSKFLIYLEREGLVERSTEKKTNKAIIYYKIDE